MLAWMIYVVVVTLLLGGAAFAGERSAHARKAPTRWLWGASIFASLLLPIVMSSVSIQIPSLSSAIDQTTPQKLIPLRQITYAAARPSAWLGAGAGSTAAPDMDAILASAWSGTSGLILLATLFNGAQLYWRQRAWERQLMAGVSIYVSEDVGPAVVGLVRPRIVVPRWITHAAPETQALVLAHEKSHLDANDAQLLAVAILLIVMMPWNLPLWWQLRRLRFAIEMDCDARVLKGGHDVSLYGETLIMVGERQSTNIAAVAAMSESKSFLEIRLGVRDCLGRSGLCTCRRRRRGEPAEHRPVFASTARSFQFSSIRRDPNRWRRNEAVQQQPVEFRVGYSQALECVSGRADQQPL